MTYLTLDIETYPFAFIIEAKDNNGEWHEYSSCDYVDTQIIKQFCQALCDYDWVVTFNGASFDLRVLAWIASSNANWISVKEISEEAGKLIQDMNGAKNGFTATSKCWNIKSNLLYEMRKNHFDVFRCYTVDKTKGLKHWELYRGQSVKESSVDFNSLICTKSEFIDCCEYCKHDVEATESLFLDKACQELIEARTALISECPCYVYPDTRPADLAELYCYGNISYEETTGTHEYVPWEQFDVPSEVKKGLMLIAEGGEGFEWNGIQYGKGGAHYVKKGRNDNVHIFDVASLYPHIIRHYTRLKNEDATERYVSCLDKRLELKRLKSSDPSKYSKAKDLGYKLVLNSLSGKFRQQGSLAYAPCCGLAMCIIGQLAITEAAMYAIEDRLEDLVEINTDSFAVVGERSIERAREYCKTSYEKHCFNYEEEVFEKSYWNDVNNYVVFNEDGTLKETHGQDSSDLVKKANELVVVRSLFNNVMLEEGSKPVLEESEEFKDYLVKYSKPASSKNAAIDGIQMRFKHYYFMWVTEDCPDAHSIEFSNDRIDKAHGLIKSRYGVYAFDPEELRKYFKYIDRQQYIMDLKQQLVVWNRGDLCSEFAAKLTRAKVIARNKAIKECRTFGEIKKLMQNFYSEVSYKI